jgi:hypothetical protein
MRSTSAAATRSFSGEAAASGGMVRLMDCKTFLMFDCGGKGKENVAGKIVENFIAEYSNFICIFAGYFGLIFEL